MNVREACEYVKQRHSYKKDRFGFWRVMSGSKMRGDCEDVSLTVGFLHFGGWKGLIMALWSKDFILWTGQAANGRHAMGQIGDLWFDNWTMEPLSKEQFLSRTGHKLNKPYHPAWVTLKLTHPQIWMPIIAGIILYLAL